MASSLVDISETLFSKLEDNFISNGFILNRKKKIFQKQDGNWKFLFQIDIINKHDYFTIHLKLSVYNSNIIFLQEKLREKISLKHPSMILSKSLKTKVIENDSLVADLTDWKELDVDGKLHIWFESFSNLEAIKDLDSQLELSIELALKWFICCKDWDYVINYNIARGLEPSIEKAFIILKYLNRVEELSNVFSRIKNERSRKKLSTISIENYYNLLV